MRATIFHKAKQPTKHLDVAADLRTYVNVSRSPDNFNDFNNIGIKGRV